MALFFESAWGLFFGCYVAGFLVLFVRCFGGLCIAVYFCFSVCNLPPLLLGLFSLLSPSAAVCYQ